MLCKPLFIVHGRVKVFRTYTGVQKRSAFARKVGVAHAQRDRINAKLQIVFIVTIATVYKLLTCYYYYLCLMHKFAYFIQQAMQDSGHQPGDSLNSNRHAVI